MTDNELWELYTEEMRLYRAYVRTLSGDTLVTNQRVSPQRVDAARRAWLSARDKLGRAVDGTGRLTALIRAKATREEVRRAR